MPNCFYRISAKALCFNEEGQLLVCIEKSGSVDLPGGGIEHGEDPIEALKREVKEEMGVEVEILEETPCYFLTGKAYFESLNKDCDYANIFYKAKIKNLNIVKSDECQEAKYVSLSNLRKMKCNSNVLKLLTYLQ